MSLDFNPQAEPTSKKYPLKTLLKADKMHSGSTIDSGIIRGIFHLDSVPFVPVGNVSQWGIKSLFILQLYTPLDWAMKQPKQNPDTLNRHFGKTVTYRGTEWIVGNRFEISPIAKEREIDVAYRKIAWCHDFLNRFEDLENTGESLDDFTQKKINEARNFAAEGRKTLNENGLRDTFLHPHEWEIYYQNVFLNYS